jgi:hypothetical protein
MDFRTNFWKISVVAQEFFYFLFLFNYCTYYIAINLKNWTVNLIVTPWPMQNNHTKEIKRSKNFL